MATSALVLGAEACSDSDTPSKPRVAVVGAGIAGLHCAYRLQQSGVDVVVYEASSRVGGRMFTARDYPDGQLIELGGEFIDSNHATLLALADEFDIVLDDRQQDDTADTIHELWFVGGVEVPEATIVEQFTAVAATIADAMAAADNPDDDMVFVELDGTTLADYLDATVPPADYRELHAVLTSAYRGEFGLETSEQSALNLVYLIGSDEPDPFRIFGESDERFHTHDGNDTFPSVLADKLGKRVELNSKLIGLSGDDSKGFTLELEDSKTSKMRSVRADHVVIAIPYSVLRKVTLDVPLTELKQQIIAELGYGTNAKLMGSFTSPVWRERNSTGSVTSDAPFQQVWDTSIGQAGKSGILTNFLGGEAGAAVGALDVELAFTGVLSDLEAVFPGVTEAYRTGSARRMHWPTYAYTLGSYTCYRPGQWSFWTQEGVREGNVHFCGEHTSADFQGWMEGGAETGALVAAEILADLKLEPSPELAAIVETKSVVPQPALSGGQVSWLGYRERRRRLNAQGV
ncbi:MAG: NAD(P)/FAD-dependent oxidoreductase [Polyangiaceae bacterium]